ncbi:uncharacterized protein LOC132722258 [Ruditapes philippinarum]|uniref:uncharacterized protein LOC132722258 n=1 Tax=Ruditapes philippinarum TaxID=129788 RepID=UPI00295A9CD1|nr:uncharacterized protein LOC132722258 [Ruditapes philippinarum]
MSIKELQRLYPDCIHIKASRKVYRKYDQDNGIEAIDESFVREQGADHRYLASEEFFEVPHTKLLVCRRGGSSRFGLVDKKLKCQICKKECEHSRHCREVKNRGFQSQYFELIENLLSPEPDQNSIQAIRTEAICL